MVGSTTSGPAGNGSTNEQRLAPEQPGAGRCWHFRVLPLPGHDRVLSRNASLVLDLMLDRAAPVSARHAPERAVWVPEPLRDTATRQAKALIIALGR